MFPFKQNEERHVQYPTIVHELKEKTKQTINAHDKNLSLIFITFFRTW
jgi:hypothetical protein